MSAAHHTFISERFFTRTAVDVSPHRRRIFVFGVGASSDVVADAALQRLSEAPGCAATSVTLDALFGVGALSNVPAEASLLRLREEFGCAAPAAVVDCTAEADTISDTMPR